MSDEYQPFKPSHKNGAWKQLKVIMRGFVVGALFHNLFSVKTKILGVIEFYSLSSAYNEVAFNEKSPITKENLCTKYTPFTYKYVVLNEKPPIMKQNLNIFFFVIGRVECILL